MRSHQQGGGGILMAWRWLAWFGGGGRGVWPPPNKRKGGWMHVCGSGGCWLATLLCPTHTSHILTIPHTTHRRHVVVVVNAGAGPPAGWGSECGGGDAAGASRAGGGCQRGTCVCFCVWGLGMGQWDGPAGRAFVRECPNDPMSNSNGPRPSTRASKPQRHPILMLPTHT